jgi:hypothetical protein
MHSTYEAVLIGVSEFTFSPRGGRQIHDDDDYYCTTYLAHIDDMSLGNELCEKCERYAERCLLEIGWLPCWSFSAKTIF